MTYDGWSTTCIKVILRATATIFKGYLDNSVTVAFPIPELAPVTKTTLSVQRSILFDVFSSNKTVTYVTY